MRKIISGILVFFALSSNIYAYTLAQIRASIRYKIQDSSTTTNNPRWSDSELNFRINEVQRDISRYTRCIYAQYVTTPTAEVREYLKPSNCLTIDRVSFLQTSSTNTYKKLEFKTIGGLDRDISGWESYPSGRPLYYYERGEYIGFERPVSSTYAISGALKIDYYKYPADMTTDSDEPFDALVYLKSYHSLIILGVSIKCKQDEMKWSEAQALQGEYASLINTMIDSLRFKTDNAVQHIKIGD